MGENTAAVPLYNDRHGERGAGGKFKKPPSRKPPASPYARPLAVPTNKSGRGGWLSKLVDPAYRLISGGATRIIPSFFSKPSFDAPPLLPITEKNDAEYEEVIPSAKDEEKCTSSSVILKSTERKDPNEVLDKGKSISQDEKLGQEIPESSHHDSGISRIEQLMKGKTFSREEILHLTEILKAKVTDETEKDKSSMPAGRDTEGALLLHETPRRLTERRQEDANRAQLAPFTYLPQTNVQDEVGASPIDLARAYMGRRMSDQSPGSHSLLTKNERDPENVNRLFLLPPSPKPSPCWPGTSVGEQQGYTTPQNQRSRFGLHDFPRTPYSRTLLSKSRTKTQGDNRWLDLSVKTSQHQARTKNDVFDYSYGSVGPIRRMRDKLSSEPRSLTSIFLNPSLIEKSLAPKTFSPAVGKNKEIDETNGTPKSNIVDHRVFTYENSVSTEATNRIMLDHFRRHKPTPKEKALELERAIVGKESSSAQVSDARPNVNVSLLRFGEPQVLKTIESGTTKSFKDGDSEKGIIQTKSGDTVLGVAKATTDVNTIAPGIKINSNAGPSLFSQNTDSQFKIFSPDSTVPSSYQDSTAQKLSIRKQSNGQSVSTVFNSVSSKPANEITVHTSGTKPILPSIAINKPDMRRGVFSDNSIGFSFPVPASSGALSEPPTPSMSSSTSKVASRPEEPSAVPSYSFGAKTPSQRLIFSFPSTSNASARDDASDIKFNFGTDGKSRLSFSAVGKAAC